MNKLIFPSYPFRLRSTSLGEELFDEFRKKWVILTPEEWVRQHVAVYLRDVVGYPGGRIGIEISLKVNTLKKRADIVVADHHGQPWMIVECKSTDIALDDQVFFQAALYNSSMAAPYLVVTNGLKLFCAEIDPIEKKWAMLNALPNYSFS